MAKKYPYGNPKTVKGTRAIIELIKEKFDNEEYGYVESLYTTWLRKSIYHQPLPLELRNRALDVYFTHFLPAENIGLEEEMKKYGDGGGWYSGTISDNKRKMNRFANRDSYSNFYPNE